MSSWTRSKPRCKKGDFDTAAIECEGDRRAIPQLTALALANRGLPTEELQQLLVDRFQRDVISDLEHRVNWTNNVIKTAPMLGLLGTVLGMMAAFGKIAAAESGVKPEELSTDIAFALITTAIGLAIAIPATACVAAINIRIRKLEDQVSAGLVRAAGDVFGPRTADISEQVSMPRLASKSIFKRKRSLEEAEMDITPMIDCTFLLLIFFLVTSKMKPELAVDLPKAKHGSRRRRAVVDHPDHGAGRG